MDHYNGYSGRERLKKYEAYKRGRAEGEVPPAVPPCQLCCDPDEQVEPHSEDYSVPYIWTPPAEYLVCRRCHGWIHKRFAMPDDWNDFKEHVARGGYAKEFTSPSTRKERQEAAAARKAGNPYEWTPLPGRTPRPRGTEWWERLTLDPSSKTDRSARPRQ